MTHAEWMFLARSLVMIALVFYASVSVLETRTGWSLSAFKQGQRRLWKKPTKTQLAIFGTVWGGVALLVLYACFSSR